MKAQFVSEWDGGTQIITSCEYDEKTKIVSDIECTDVDGLDLEMLDDEYVLLNDGTKITDFINEDES